MTAPAITGPRQTTGSFGLSTSKLSEITRTPPAETLGRMPFSLPSVPPVRPNAFGMDGPVMSASSTAVRRPRFAAADASNDDTRLLPTPPLPLATATTFPTFDHGFNLAVKSTFPFRSLQFFPQLEQSCVHSDMCFL